MSDFSNNLIPEEELKGQRSINWAPMVDFLFLILAIFAVMAATRNLLYDSDVHMVKMDSKTPPPAMAGSQPGYTILLSISEKGQYKWVTEFNEFLLDGTTAIKHELLRQQELGLLPKDKGKVKVLLQIDCKAPWEPIAKAIIAVKEAGFTISPVYTPEDS